MKKLSEAQFDRLIDLRKKYFSYSIGETASINAGTDVKSINDVLRQHDEEIYKIVRTGITSDNLNKIVALMNPYTSDLVKDDLVEKEEKYLFTYKDTDRDGDYWHLTRTLGLIVLSFDDLEYEADNHFTVKEVEEAGYDITKFNRV